MKKNEHAYWKMSWFWTFRSKRIMKKDMIFSFLEWYWGPTIKRMKKRIANINTRSENDMIFSFSKNKLVHVMIFQLFEWGEKGLGDPRVQIAQIDGVRWAFWLLFDAWTRRRCDNQARLFRIRWRATLTINICAVWLLCLNNVHMRTSPPWLQHRDLRLTRSSQKTN